MGYHNPAECSTLFPNELPPDVLEEIVTMKTWAEGKIGGAPIPHTGHSTGDMKKLLTLIYLEKHDDDIVEMETDDWMKESRRFLEDEEGEVCMLDAKNNWTHGECTK